MIGIQPPAAWPWRELRGIVIGRGAWKLRCAPRHRGEAGERAREYGLAVHVVSTDTVELRLLEEGCRRGGPVGPRVPRAQR
jgi:hypothetical protein